MSTFDDESTKRWDDTGATTEGHVTQDRTADEAQTRTVPRPKGPSWSTIALGLVCLVVAGGALLVELTELSVEWDRTGPLALVGLGVLLVLVGLAALLRRGDDDAEDQLEQ